MFDNLMRDAYTRHINSTYMSWSGVRPYLALVTAARFGTLGL